MLPRAVSHEAAELQEVPISPESPKLKLAISNPLMPLALSKPDHIELPTEDPLEFKTFKICKVESYAIP